MEEFHKKIISILGDNTDRNHENSCKYLDFLKSKIELPFEVTGIEDFPWEEPYVFGVFDKQEYEELKKTKPSYKDTFELIDLGLPRDFSDITAYIKRVSDQKTFEHGLSWLKALDETSPMYDLLNDYAIWHTNY